jgi:hypothetical protein
LLGTYGTYQHFSTEYYRERQEGGGIRKPLVFRDHEARAVLTGPVNTLLIEAKRKDTEVPFTIRRDPTNNVARIDLPNASFMLNVGEWSDWQRVIFHLDARLLAGRRSRRHLPVLPAAGASHFSAVRFGSAH